MTENWISIFGKYETKKNEIIFKGSLRDFANQGEQRPEIANLLCDEYFGGGTISVDITFEDLQHDSACEIMLYYDPNTKAFLTAGLGGSGTMFSIRSFNGNSWVNHANAGEYINLKEKKTYKIEVHVNGSSIILKVDKIVVLSTNLPYSMPLTQTGIWCQSAGNISIKNFNVDREKPNVFVVMPFISPYNELYTDVIQKVCSKFNLLVVRADETYGPGLILNDIVKQINESRLIIAEISNLNPNVYYEVGYAHALNKPTILIAENATKLPFDVSPFRTLFYENSIAGKQKIEAGLEKHLNAVLSDLDFNL